MDSEDFETVQEQLNHPLQDRIAASEPTKIFDVILTSQQKNDSFNLPLVAEKFGMKVNKSFSLINALAVSGNAGQIISLLKENNEVKAELDSDLKREE